MKKIKTLRNYKTVWILFCLIQTVLILYGCLVLQSNDLKSPIFNFDKIIHSSIYIIFSWSWLQVTRNKKLTLFLVIIFSILIEFIQPYFNRSFELLDILANSIGVMLAILLNLKLKLENFFKLNRTF